MDHIIKDLLAQAKISESLEGYTYIPIEQIDTIPLGSHVKFIDRNENIKSGGFLIKISIKSDRTKSYIILKSNLMYKLYIYYYWLFYKPIKHESKIVKVIRNYGLDILKEELPKKELELDSTSTTMNIIIKPRALGRMPERQDIPKQSKIKKNTDIHQDKNLESTQDNDIKQEELKQSKSKTKSKQSKSKTNIFKALLESLDKQKI